MQNLKQYNDDRLRDLLSKLNGTDDEIYFSHATIEDVDYISKLGFSVSYPHKSERGSVFNISVSND
jgi:hypothetical protein